MPSGDAARQREAQAAAGARGAGHAVEPIEYALAFFGRDAGAGVGHRHERARRIAGLARDDDVHAPAGRRVTHGVVEQVAEQPPQCVGIAHHAHLFGGIDAEVDAGGVGQRHEVRHSAAHEFIEFQRLGYHGSAMLLARDCEQLLHQPCDARHARAQVSERGVAILLSRLDDRLRLQVERGERCAQLVGGVGKEGPLPFERRPQSPQQIVECVGDWPHFVRQAHRCDGFDGIGPTPAQRLGEASHRPDRPRDDPGDQDRQRRHQHRERREAAHRDPCGTPFAHVHRLRDLDDAVVGLDAEHSPARRTHADGGEAGTGEPRHDVVRARQVDAHAFPRPDLDDEVVFRDSAGHARAAGKHLHLVAQQQCGLAQLRVEEGIGLGTGNAIAEPPAEGADQYHRAHQSGKQAVAQRSHAGSAWIR